MTNNQFSTSRPTDVRDVQSAALHVALGAVLDQMKKKDITKARSDLTHLANRLIANAGGGNVVGIRDRRSASERALGDASDLALAAAIVRIVEESFL